MICRVYSAAPCTGNYAVPHRYAAGNDFSATIDNLALDTNVNGAYDPGVDTIVANGGNSPLINPDNALTVFVLVTAPVGATDGQTSNVDLFAEALTGTGTPGTVFAGAGFGGGDAVAGLSGANESAIGSLLARMITVQLIKTASIADPFGGTQPVPGAIITYTLVATVNGSGSVESLLLTDPIPALTKYVPATLTLEGAVLSDLADADAGQASAAGISVNAGTVAAGSTRTVTFNVKLD